MQLVTQTVNDLFFVVAVREIDLPLFTLVKGGTSLVWRQRCWRRPFRPLKRPALRPPAHSNAVTLKTAPVNCCLGKPGRAHTPWSRLGPFAARLEFDHRLWYFGLFAVILGGALLTPLLTLLFMRGLQRLLARRFDVISRMAPRTVTRSLSRTAVAWRH
ncbi:MAG: hypothetical protein R3E79_59935 [Caldilineaceae bacterium]